MKFENTSVWGFKHAIRGMRNPMNSWQKSDSICDIVCDECVLDYCNRSDTTCEQTSFGIHTILGKNDLELMQKLIKSGSEHRKFLRQIFVSVDITAPLYWWKEFDTYKVGTVANSTSTMHKLSSTPITVDCFETDDFDEDVIDSLNDSEFMDITHDLILFLEELRKRYSETKNKKYWKELIRWLPESWLQKRTVTMNYENVLTMIHQRQNHKLNEWSGKDNIDVPNFMSWAKRLPYAKVLLFNVKE